MSDLTVLIVEDEILIAETIKIYLEQKGYRITGIAVSYEEAIQAIEDDMPQVVLLDVRLYGQKSGIDVAKYILEKGLEIPYIYLTSQFDDRILEHALDTNPIGYLTKPMQRESLWTTVALAFRFNVNKGKKESKIQIHDGSQSHIIDETKIAYLYADHVYVNVALQDKSKIVVRESLSNMKDLLVLDFFVQCHRSFIINVNMVEKFDNQSLFIQGVQIPISRSRKSEVLESLRRR